MTPAINEKDISLFQLHNELAELVALRSEVELPPDEAVAVNQRSSVNHQRRGLGLSHGTNW